MKLELTVTTTKLIRVGKQVTLFTGKNEVQEPILKVHDGECEITIHEPKFKFSREGLEVQGYMLTCGKHPTFKDVTLVLNNL